GSGHASTIPRSNENPPEHSASRPSWVSHRDIASQFSVVLMGLTRPESTTRDETSFSMSDAGVDWLLWFKPGRGTRSLFLGAMRPTGQVSNWNSAKTFGRFPAEENNPDAGTSKASCPVRRRAIGTACSVIGQKKCALAIEPMEPGKPTRKIQCRPRDPPI